MSEYLSFVFAYFFSVLFLVVGVSILRNKKEYILLLLDVSKSSTLMYFSGFLAFTTGFFIILLNNTSINVSSIVVEIFGWLSLLKGVIRILFPSVTRKVLRWFSPKFVTPAGWILIILGLTMLFLTFFVG